MDDRLSGEMRRLAEHKTSPIHPAPSQFSDDQLEADPILHFFHYAHLPAALQTISAPFCLLAAEIVGTLPRNPERTVALRKLLEAKVCAVRANIGAVAFDKEPDFLDRLKTERKELSNRLERLETFLDGEQPGISPSHATLLYDQRDTMARYLHILDMRIEAVEFERQGGPAELGEAVERGGHDIDRDGPVKFRD